jgi:ribosomal protein S18 acetylase RimI-like enzyme
MSAAPATLNQISIVDLRELRGDDLRPLLQEQGIYWRDRFRWNFATSAQAIVNYLDNRTLHGFALVSNGRPVGYCYFIVDGSKALVGDIFVSEQYATNASQKALLIRTLETAASSPGVARVEGQLLGLSFELESETIFRQPLQVFSRWFMVRDQLRAFRAERIEPSGYSFQPWGDHYLTAASELIASSYRGHDDARINDQYRDASGALRFLASSTRHTGCGPFLPAASWAATRPGSAGVSGLCLATRVDTNTGHITQICVSPADRENGVARELLRRTLTSLRANDCDAASLTVTASNVGALHLYKQMGFQPVERFAAFVWEPQG